MSPIYNNHRHTPTNVYSTDNTNNNTISTNNNTPWNTGRLSYTNTSPRMNTILE